jgi:hypothetical protein
MPRRRRVLMVLALIGALAAVALVLGAGGHYERFPVSALRTPAARRHAPVWTRPCKPPAIYNGLDCARVAGRVVWIQRHDPDGDGDRHLILVSRLHVRIAKLEQDVHVPLPSLGQTFSGTGVTKRGASGRIEVWIERVDGR